MKDLEELVSIFTLSMGSIVEGIAAIIMAHAILSALFFYGLSTFPVTHRLDKMEIRLRLGKALALALEFLLAADILRTAVAPTWDEIGKLAAIAALRTFLNFFLEREIKHSVQN